MNAVIINSKDYDKAKKLLVEHDIQTEPESGNDILFLRKSDVKPDETPAVLGGI